MQLLETWNCFYQNISLNAYINISHVPFEYCNVLENARLSACFRAYLQNISILVTGIEQFAISENYGETDFSTFAISNLIRKSIYVITIQIYLYTSMFEFYRLFFKTYNFEVLCSDYSYMIDRHIRLELFYKGMRRGEFVFFCSFTSTYFALNPF